MNSYHSGINNKIYNLSESPFATGGEGSIYFVLDDSSLAAKIYKREKATVNREKKIKVMLDIDPGQIPNVTWPLDSLYDSNGRFVGYIMKKIDNCEKLINFYVYDNRNKYSWALYVRVARNIAATLYNIHSIGQIVGDLNPENVLCNVESGIVTMVDADSYHIRDRQGNFLRCEVGMPEFIAPELQGVEFATAPVEKTFTMNTDNFALAVLIFRLLMNGAHPFSCIRVTKSTSNFQPVDNIKNGYCFYLKPMEGFDIPVYSPSINIIPEYLRTLFEKAFLKSETTTLRPYAIEWYKALCCFEDELVACEKNKKHVFWNQLPSCPWCDIESKMEMLIPKQDTENKSSNEEPEEKIETHTKEETVSNNDDYQPPRLTRFEWTIIIGLIVFVICYLIAKI